MSVWRRISGAIATAAGIVTSAITSGQIHVPSPWPGVVALAGMLAAALWQPAKSPPAKNSEPPSR